VKQHGGIFKQAQQIQARLMKLQEEAESITAEAGAGGGMVTAVANGKGELVSLKIERDVVDPEDVGMLEDLVTAAVSEALRKAKEAMTEEMKKAAGGLNIPGMF
jgi:DNA-binding YbaB/EbfC family protein